MATFTKRKFIILILLLLLLTLLINIILFVRFVVLDLEEEVISEEEQEQEEYEPAFITERKAVYKDLYPEGVSTCPGIHALTTFNMKYCLSLEIDYLNSEIEKEQSKYIEAQRRQGREGTEADKQEFVKRLEDALKQSNKDREAYIDSYCSFKGYEYYGGSLGCGAQPFFIGFTT